MVETEPSPYQLLNASETDRRRKAIFALVRHVGSTSPEGPWRSALERIGSEDPSPELRYLGRKALDILIRRLGSEGGGPDATPSIRWSDPTREELLEGLVDSDPIVRLEALRAIAGQKEIGEEWLPTLVERVGPEDHPRVRAELVRVLGMRASGTQVPLLVRFLEDPDPRVRANVVEALEGIGTDTAYKGLLAALSDPDHRVRINAIKAMGSRDPRTVLRSCRRMLEAEEYWVRDAVVYCLGSSQDPGAVALLGPLLGDPVPGIRIKARRFLRNLADRGSEAARLMLGSSPDDEEEEESLDAFLTLENPPSRGDTSRPAPSTEDLPPDLPILVRILATAEDAEERIAVIHALERAAPESVERILAPHREDPDPRVRLVLAQLLARRRRPEARALLGALLEDPDPAVRGEALIAVAPERPTLALDALDELIESDDPDFRLCALDVVIGLWEHGTRLPESAQVRACRLTRALTGDPDPEVAEKAGFVMGILETPFEESSTEPES